MNKITTIILFLMLSVRVAAQHEQSATDFCKSYTRISAGYSGLQLYSNTDNTEYDTDMFAPGFAIAFHYGTNQMIPRLVNPSALYFEVGAELSNNTKTMDPDTKYEVKTRFNVVSATIPLSIGFRTHINDNNKDCFVTYAGFSPKVNIAAKMKNKYHTYDMFSGEDMGEEFTATHVQFGLHAGLGFEIGNVGINYKFTFDYLPFQSYELNRKQIETKTLGHVISISYMFKK